MVELGTFVTVSLVLFSCIIGVGSMALIAKTTLENRSKEFSKDVTELEQKTVNLRIEIQGNIERIRVETKADINRITDGRQADTIQFAEALAKFNTLLTTFQVQMAEMRLTSNHTNETLKNID